MRGEGFQLSFFLDLLYFFLLNDFSLASLFQSHDQKHTFDFPTYGYKVYFNLMTKSTLLTFLPMAIKFIRSVGNIAMQQPFYHMYEFFFLM